MNRDQWREHLAQADQHIAQAKRYITRERSVISTTDDDFTKKWRNRCWKPWKEVCARLSAIGN